jgi:excinuclease ABC subunit B
MFKAAKDLDFEKAANFRDDIEAYRAQIVKNS